MEITYLIHLIDLMGFTQLRQFENAELYIGLFHNENSYLFLCLNKNYGMLKPLDVMKGENLSGHERNTMFEYLMNKWVTKGG